MPANLTPQYYEAEKKFRSAKRVEEKIMALEEMLAVMPKHKGTDHLKADLRRKIARLNQESERKSGAKRASMLIEKEGAGQVAIIGMTNAGKSQLVDAITNASPPVAEYPFTTQAATPGMMEFENIRIQLIDTPPLAEQSVHWWLPHMIKRADALVVVLDLSQNPLNQMETVIAQLAGMRVSLGEIGLGDEDIIILERKKVLVLGNKLDIAGDEAYRALKDKYGALVPVVAASARRGDGMEQLRQAIYDMLEIIRVYTKAPGKKTELDDPIVLPRGSTMDNAAGEVHKDFRAKLKYARIWGSGKHDGVMVKRNHILQDGDVVELHQSK